MKRKWRGGMDNSSPAGHFALIAALRKALGNVFKLMLGNAKSVFEFIMARGEALLGVQASPVQTLVQINIRRVIGNPGRAVLAG